MFRNDCIAIISYLSDTLYILKGISDAVQSIIAQVLRSGTYNEEDGHKYTHQKNVFTQFLRILSNSQSVKLSDKT